MLKTAITGLLVILFGGCKHPSNAIKLRIAAAASVQFMVDEWAEEFSKIHEVETEIISSSSGKLTTQILNGAPYDIFFAADMSYPNVLAEKGKVQDSTKLYGYGVPVLWTTDRNLNFSDLDALLKSEKINRIAIANPKNAPYGKMAVNFLSDRGLYDALKEKLVFGESISQVNEYVLSKNVELAIGAQSVVNAPKLRGKAQHWSLDKKYWIPQGMVMLKNSNSLKWKRQFFDFVQSPQGQDILERYGFKQKK